MRTDKRASQKADKKSPLRAHKRGVVGYSKKSALLEEAITHMNTGKYGRSSAALKELLALDPHNTEARRLFATLHLRLGSLVTARQAFESLANEAIGRQDYWLAESLLREYLAAGPRCVPFLEQLAHVYQEKGDELAAVNELGKAIEILRDDPDPDNPQKAAQLYSKIRELAPASPVAFQLASLFDVQTGEFLVRSAAVPSPVDSEPALTQEEVTASVPSEAVAAEVMPWEQIDESQPTSSDAVAGATAVPEPVRIQDEPPVSPPVSVELVSEEATARTTPPDDFLNGAPSPAESLGTAEPEIPAPSGPGASPDFEKESIAGIAAPMPWDQVADASLRIQETAPPETPETPGAPDSVASAFNSEGPHYVGAAHSEPAPVPVLDPAPTAQSPEPPASESASLPSPMPWEQVADPAIAIPEPEPPLVLATAPSEPMLSTPVEPAENPLPSSPVDAGPPPLRTGATETISFMDSVTQAEPPVAAAPPHAETTIEPAIEEPPAASFSWQSVFDKAWKFTAGPAAPIASPPSEEEAGREGSPELRLADPPAETGREQSGTVSPAETLAARDEWTANVAAAVPESPAPSFAPSFTESSRVSETRSLTSEPQVTGGITETLPDQGSAPADAPPEENPASHLPEFRIPAETGSPASTPTFASFSTVVEAHDIPEAESATPVLNEGSPVFTPAVAPAVSEPTLQATSTGLEPSAPPTTVPPPVSDSPRPELATEVAGSAGHWKTGEVAVQVHRPTAKKKRWEKEPEGVEQPSSAPASNFESLSETLTEAIREWESKPVQASAPPVVEEVVPPPDTRPEWMQASDAITFTSSGRHVPRIQPVPPVFPSSDEPEPARSIAESAVDVLFSPSRTGSHPQQPETPSWTKPRPRLVARLHRVRIGVISFVGSCFSTTRSLTFLALAVATATVVVAGMGVGVLGVTWMTMEEPPSGLYQGLTINPPRAISDPRRNGYFMLLGFDAASGDDPLQAGYERKGNETDVTAARACMSGDDPKDGTSSAGASAHVVKGWFRSGDPLAQLKGQGETIRSLVARESSSLARYQKWIGMPFDDWGYGQMMSPDCERVLLAHRLFLLDGFSQGPAAGLDRLDADLQSWRIVLAQSKTLMTKMLAVAAVQDDAAVVSSLLSRAELDGSSLSRLSKMVRPLDQVELSVRWPMQSHFVWATKSTPSELRQDKGQDRPWYVSMVTAMRLPVQRRANAYADYYEASNKAVAEGRFANLPKPPGYLRNPATGPMDYVTNPIENIVGIEPLPAWDPYVMRMLETDAQLRLVGLQAWIRRGPQEGDLLTRLAKAGQAYYDPFTGLPMLVNQRKGVLYSVGRDGKDQEGDRTHDVAVAIPSVPSAPAENKRAAPGSPARSL